jgi:acyl-CoA reductase-like NAD-dependent aldehyde dehydrogenase
MASVGQANAALIRRDLKSARAAQAALAAVPTRDLIEICGAAADRFMRDRLPVSEPDGALLGPDEYVRRLSATTGLPFTLCRKNMEKIESVLRHMGTIVAGLTRGLDPALLDTGMGVERGIPLRYAREADVLGVILPSNSPGVNSLWLPAIAFKVPVILKPGHADPFTTIRIAQALFAAGCPREAISIYPSDHAGAEAVISGCGRVMLFGDSQTTAPWARDPRVQLHGPGWSKVLLGEDEADRWERHLDTMVASIVDNGGRSCVNASVIVVPRHGDAVANALAERLAKIVPLAPEDPQARLAAFTDSGLAERINAAVESGLATPGAEDVTARYRKGSRLVQQDGLSYVLPTIVRCRSGDHPLAVREFLFPYASVLEIPRGEVFDRLGPTLALTVISNEQALLDALSRAPNVERLNVGPIPTATVRWDQPHEGNLFDFLFSRRAVQRVKAST